jgi:hypothetical protein
MIRRIDKTAREQGSKPGLKLVGGSDINVSEIEPRKAAKEGEPLCKDGICTLNWKPQRPALLPLTLNESAA